MKKILILIIFIFSHSLFSINYITTAESIGWSGAHASIARGFEAMLYNPAGLYFTDYKFGLNLFGSYGFRLYDNVFSSDDILKILKKISSNDPDITTIIAHNLNQMPQFGLLMGADISMFNLMLYIKFINFSLGISMIPRTMGTMTIGKSLFSTLFQKLSLQNPINLQLSMFALQYLDLNFNLSTRVKFLEKVIPVKGIYAGLTTHFYIPTLFFNLAGETSLKKGSPDSTTGIYTFDLSITGQVNMSMNSGLSEIFKQLPMFSQLGLSSLLQNSGTAAFGLGWDMGFLIHFNRFIRYGFAINDLGFFVFPGGASKKIAIDLTINPTNITNLVDQLQLAMRQDLLSEYQKNGSVTWFMPATTIRTGVGVTPVKRKHFEMLIAADISLSDLNRLLIKGFPTFHFATGIEIKPKINWVEFPIRTSFSYNSQSNYPGLAFGVGLYLGPVELEFAVKGLEFLISGWGAREICLGTDFKLEF